MKDMIFWGDGVMHLWVLGIGYLLPDWRGGSKKSSWGLVLRSEN